MRKALAAVGLLVGRRIARRAARTEIEPDALLGHIKFLASDDLKGRGNGCPKARARRRLHRRAVQGHGAAAGRRNGSWFQPFELDAGLIVGPSNTLSFQSRGRTVTADAWHELLPARGVRQRHADAVGRSSIRCRSCSPATASRSRDLGYDDYANIDVVGQGRAHLQRTSRRSTMPSSRLNGTRPMPQTSLNAKAQLARSHGARRLDRRLRSVAPRTTKGSTRCSRAIPTPTIRAIPCCGCGATEMQPLLDAWGLDAIARQIDTRSRPRSEALTGATVDYVEHLTQEPQDRPQRRRHPAGQRSRARARSDRHRRALRSRRARRSALGDARPRPARSTTAPTTTPRARRRSSKWPRAAMAERARFPRTLVFIAFAGEERGLLGSAYYASHAAIPIDEHDRDAQSRHGRACARRRRRQRTRRVAVDGSRSEGGRDGRGRRSADQA